MSRSRFWEAVEAINNFLVGCLTSSETVTTSYNYDELKQKWWRYLSNCPDDQLDRYCDRFSLNTHWGCTVETYGRYACERKIAEYCAENNIDIFYI